MLQNIVRDTPVAFATTAHRVRETENMVFGGVINAKTANPSICFHFGALDENRKPVTTLHGATHAKI